MKKIIVAGAGHGGLAAAALLAKQGYDVTVIEAKKRAEMGHDWHDVMVKSSLTDAGFDLRTIESTEEVIFIASAGTTGTGTGKLPEAVKRAKDYLSGALAAELNLGKGRGPMDHAYLITEPDEELLFT